MSKKLIEDLIQQALRELTERGDLPNGLGLSFQVDHSKEKQHGDFASNAALVFAKTAKVPPRELAQKIINILPKTAAISKVELAGPGFINFFLAEGTLHQVVADVLTQREQFGTSHVGKGKKIIIEYVSSNPTGPLHVGHGRHGAYGAVVANLMAATGYDVHREYYVNDAGRQMDILAVSTWLRYLELLGETIPVPANAYKGLYVIEIAKTLKNQHDTAFQVPSQKIFENCPLDEPAGGDKEIYIDAIVQRARSLLGEAAFEVIFNLSLQSMLADIRNDLEEFGVTFDHWFSEREFVKTHAVDQALQTLQKNGFLYERDGAIWLRSTDFNDEKDRVVQRSNGQRTYFANDLAYHIDKFKRGFECAIDIFGADHHGYIPRVRAGLEANGIAPNLLTYLLVQFVTLYRGNEQVQMSTRSGSFVTLRELREEVGNDAARFFYVMRRAEQHIDFDLELAKSQTNENPVYYIQYAHARICSVFRQLKEKAYDEQKALSHLDRLMEPQEKQLCLALARYPQTLNLAAEQHSPHLLTHYLKDLATDFHAYYHAHPFLVEDEALRAARLALISATRQVFVNALKLLGVSAPESM